MKRFLINIFPIIILSILILVSVALNISFVLIVAGLYLILVIGVCITHKDKILQASDIVVYGEEKAKEIQQKRVNKK